MFLNYLIS